MTDALELYFQTCAMEADVDSLAVRRWEPKTRGWGVGWWCDTLGWGGARDLTGAADANSYDLDLGAVGTTMHVDSWRARHLSFCPPVVQVMAGTLANGGVCPITGERVFTREAVGSCLAIMFTCGMYNSSGKSAALLCAPMLLFDALTLLREVLGIASCPAVYYGSSPPPPFPKHTHTPVSISGHARQASFRTGLVFRPRRPFRVW